MRPERESVFVALLLAAIVLAVGISGVLLRLDHLILDTGQRLGQRVAADDLVIVAIDEASLDRLGRWPWPRANHAALVDILCAAQPAAIGLDIAFSEISPAPQDDAALAQAVARCGRVVLPLVIETAGGGGQMLESPPLAGLLSGAAGLGRVSVRLDEDGIARTVDLREGLGTAAWPLFAEELLRVGGQLALSPSDPPEEAAPLSPSAHDLVRHGQRLINFSGPPGHMPRVSYASVLEGGVPTAYFAGKTVLVGATAVGLGDFLPTPVSAHAQPMSGVEVQANIWLSMRDGRLIRLLPDWLALSLSLLLAWVPLVWLVRLMPLPGLLASMLWVALLILASALLPGVLQFWFPPAAAVVGSLSAFPLWSWRRLEAARRHLDLELRQLASVLPSASAENETAGVSSRMGFEQRIVWVQAAQARMRTLEAQRNDALAFISHDLRSPLANAVQQLEDAPEGASVNLLPSLRRALSMAQDFLSLARAEALEPRRMKVLELGSLLHQATDEMYAALRQRGQQIERQLPDAPAWVRGDFEALERCAINLLHNAMTYAPAQSCIAIGLTESPDTSSTQLRFWIENDGAPLAPALVARLFQRYSRGEPGSGNATSTGLGLFYVRTVAEKHGGTVGVDCMDGRVRFWVALPSVPDGSMS